MAEHGLDTTNVTVVPHGNYVGTYPDDISQDDVRRTLGLPDDRLVVLFFGNVLPYKGVDTLLDVVEDLGEPTVMLVVAGACPDRDLPGRLQRLSEQARVRLHDGRVADDDVQVFLRASDVVCLPFTTITTSGSLVLALSFAKPVVAPRMGGLNDLPDAVGYFYDHAQAERGLADALRRVVEDRDGLEERGRRGRRFVTSTSWEEIAIRTCELYRRAVT